MSNLDVELFMGPLVVGYMFGTLLFGMLIVQMFMYHMNFPKDIIGIRLVAPINVSVNLWLASSIACDLMITFTMIFILSRARGQSAFKPTLETLSRIINFTMETGLVTTVWAIIQLILWVETPTRGFVFFLYSNWLISTLNSRTYVTQDTSKSAWNAVDVTRSQTRPTIWADIPSTDFKINPFERLGAAINVSTTTEVHGESSEAHEMEIAVPAALKQKSGR
ncbi:hypothetical protein EYR36_002972 [Pleurotus pulmonarius]|nr:hypothetical protein EYR36_002972 [Pleurotus pulmonarius]